MNMLQYKPVPIFCISELTDAPSVFRSFLFVTYIIALEHLFNLFLLASTTEKRNNRNKPHLKSLV